MPVLGETGNTLHFRVIQNQQQKYVVGYFPSALDSMSPGGPEAKSGVIVCVPENDDKWAAGVLQFPVSRFDQFAADALALVFRKHRHGAESHSRHVATHGQRTVHDVTYHLTIQSCNQGQPSGSVGPQGIDDVAFLILPECAFVHVTYSRDITRMLFSNLDHHA